MNTSRRFTVVEHLSNAELDDAIDVAQTADETRLVRRLCFVKNLYEGKTQQQAGAAVGVSQPTSSRWARAWNQNMIEGLRPRFGGGRPPKLTPSQWDEICAALEDGQPWTPREIHALIEDRYDVTYHPTHLARKLRASGMNYAKPRPMDPRSPDDAEEILAERLPRPRPRPRTSAGVSRSVPSSRRCHHQLRTWRQSGQDRDHGVRALV